MPNSMKKYFIRLFIVTIIMVVAAFIPMWCEAQWFQAIMPVIPLYFCVVAGVEHYLIVRSTYKDPRIFIKNFLMLTVITLLLHLAVIVVWSFTHLTTAKSFLLAFCVAYLVYMVYEVAEQVVFIKHQRNNSGD